MLKRLRIRNLAVVEDVELSFGPGLNVLTGSTGAGKSLILGAVNLLLGERASADQIRRGEDRAEVEATFDGSAGLEGVESGEVVLRREIRSGAGGRSHATINGRPATMKELQAIAARFIEPHGQNEQFRLRDVENHVEYIDAFAGNESLRRQYTRALESYRKATRDRDAFERRIAQLRERSELLEHRLAELDRTGLEPGEKDDLERSLRVLENSERIAETLQAACAALYDEDGSALSTVAEIRKTLASVAGIDDGLAGFADDVKAAEIGLTEAVDAMRRYLDALDHDPDVVRTKRDRLDALIGMEKRYGKPIDELAAAAETWREELDGLAFEDEQRAALEDASAEAAAALSKAAMRLTDSRRKAAARLDERMTSALSSLMMRGARFRTDISLARDDSSAVEIDGVPVSVYDHGVDHVRLMVRTNPGELEGGVDRIASTGETSRIALALKKLTGAGMQGSLLIFDEIDAGVGADLGDVIADELADLSRTYQIICITHMPQIAARGALHLVVSKKTARGRTIVDVYEVSGEKRRDEVARMLGGEKGSAHRIALAGELLERRGT